MDELKQLLKIEKKGIEAPKRKELTEEQECWLPREIHHSKKIGLFFISYYKVPPNTALIISGGKSGIRVVTGGSTFVYPTEIAKELSLEIIAVNILEEHVRTKDAIPLDINALVQFKINDDEESIKIAAQSFLDRPLRDIANIVREALKGHLRDICASLSTEDIFFDRERLQAAIADSAEPDLRKLGLTIKLFVLKDIIDTNGFFEYEAKYRQMEKDRKFRALEENMKRI